MFGLATAGSVRQLESELRELRHRFDTYVASDAARIAASVNASAQLRTAAARIERATDRAAARERKRLAVHDAADDEQDELVSAGSFREALEAELSLTDEDDDDEAPR